MSKSKSLIKVTYSDGYIENRTDPAHGYSLRRKGDRPILIEVFGSNSPEVLKRCEYGVHPLWGKVVVKQ